MRRRHLTCTLLLLFASQFLPRAHGQQTKLTEQQAYETGKQAYVYAYPIVLMELTRRVFLNRGNALNQFNHARAFPPPQARAVIRPNVDTLYSTAWLDLSREPLILSVPDTAGRYYLLQFLDAWTETFAVPGPRTTGTKAGRFGITGPDWKGKLPAGVQAIKAPTNMVWIIGRTQTNGVADYGAVQQIQSGFQLSPATGGNTPGSSQPPTPIDRMTNVGTTPPQQVAAMDATTFFKTFAELLKSNAPHAGDGRMLAKLKSIGIEPGKDFDAGVLGPQAMTGLERAAKDALSQLTDSFMKDRQMTNGWGFRMDKVGTYGTSYQERAAVALFGLGALAKEDAIYGTADVDDEGKALNGSNRYVIHFEKNALPPVRAFWSVTLYGPDGFFVENSSKRYALGDRDKLVYNQNGSLDIYIQRDKPDGATEANWLPAPEGAFNLSMRLYWPKPEVSKGTWRPAAVKRVR
ncbi:MAG: DUF1254 domain-containing protein [Acidobacteriota bacterium]